jgi:hypothetical protein
MEHVSLSFNKKWHLKVCTCYGNENVRMKPISYRIHEIVLKVFDISANGLTRKFKSMCTTTLVNKLLDEVASKVSLLYVKLYELPISSGAIRCNEIAMRSGDFLRLGKRFVESSRRVMKVRDMCLKVQ